MGRSVSIFAAFLLAAAMLPGCAAAQAVPPPGRSAPPAASATDLLHQAASRDATAAAAAERQLAILADQQCNALPVIARAVGDSSPRVAAIAVSLLRRHGDGATEALAGVCHDPSPRIRRAALLELANCDRPDPAALGAVANGLNDSDVGVCRAAAIAARDLSDLPGYRAAAADVPSLVPALTAASQHYDAGIRRSATTALVRTSGDGARYASDWGRHGSARPERDFNYYQSHGYSYAGPPPTGETHEEHVTPGFAGATFFIAMIALRAVIGGKRRRATRKRRIPVAARQPSRRPSTVAAAATTRCPRCQKIMPTPAVYCRRCGLPLRITV